MGFHKFRWWLCRSSNTSFCSSLAFKVEVSVHRAVPGIEGNVSKTSGCILEGPTAAECLCFALLYCLKCKRIMKNLSKTVWFDVFFHFDNQSTVECPVAQQCSCGFDCRIRFNACRSGIHGSEPDGCPGQYDVGMTLKIGTFRAWARWEAWCCEDDHIRFGCN